MVNSADSSAAVPLDVTVMIPAYLEEENLRILLPRITHALESLKVRFEVLVIDTHEAMDHTELACKELGARMVRRAPGNSFGDALRTGIQACRGEKLIVMDADGSHPPELIPKLYTESKTADLVAASRYVPGGATENTPVLQWMSWLLNKSYALILGLPLADVSNNFKLYCAADLKALKLKCDNFDIIEEILFKLKRVRPSMMVVEIPFVFKKRMFGKTKRNLIVFVLTYIYTLIRLRFSK